ncbi:hypothetical protein [Klebsiella pneumoniae]|uniref:hypothetical protein n=1 Tax=Klebsiella pneumoniae TaxID=573 RepID=UPI003464B570
MTVSTEVDHNDYTGNGVTTSFPYTFRIFKKSDLTVQLADLNENITVLTLDTDYTVTGAGTYSGGNVVLMSPLASGWQISISRDLPVTQETDLRNQGKFFAEVHEDAFDKLTMLIQQCFSFLRLALRKPSFIANYYDALNNRIRNLRDPSQAQDAATKNYVDGQIVDNTNAWKAGDAVLDNKIDANFARTLRVPDVSVDMLPSAMYRKRKVHTYDAATGQPLLIDAGQLSVGDILNLSSSDGFKYIGKCKSVASLRTIEPTISGESIILERAVPDGPLLNLIITHNPIPSDTVDDGYSRFVTPGGAVWDADISKGINVFLAGYSASLNNLAQCLNKIIQDKVKKVIARGYVIGGVDSEIVIPSNPNSNDATVFVMTDTVRIPSFLKVHAPNGAIFDYSAFTTGVAIIGSNEFTGLTNDMMFLNNGGGWGTGAGSSNSHNAGGFIGNGCLIKGPNTSSNPNATTYPGVRWGNVTYPSNSYAHFRDAVFMDAKVSGWAEGIRIGSIDTYIINIIGCHFTRNGYGVATRTAWSGSTPQWANSGEKILFRGCLISDNVSHAVYLDNRGDFFTFDMCSMDYNGGDVFFCSPTNLGKVVMTGGHIEGNGGLILNCPSRTTSDGENNVKIISTQLYANKTRNDPYGGVRNIVFGTNIRTILELDNCDIFCRAPYVNGPYPTWKSYDPTNLARLIIRYPGSGQTYRFLPSFDGANGYRINNALLFTGAENANVPTSKGTSDFWCIKSGSSSCVYGGSGDADGDGVIPVKITLTSPTESVQLLLSIPEYPPRGTQHVHGFCSIKAAGASGAVNVSAIARTIASVTRTANLTTGAVTDTENLYGINQSITQDIITSLANSTISITANDYMGTRPLPVQLTGGPYSYLGFIFTGFVGTIYVKLPVWAYMDLHPTIGYQ